MTPAATAAATPISNRIGFRPAGKRGPPPPAISWRSTAASVLISVSGLVAWQSRNQSIPGEDRPQDRSIGACAKHIHVF
jgi:hypothetical protein